ncbi:MAG: YkvA family protein [Gemmatimonadota bacterium]
MPRLVQAFKSRVLRFRREILVVLYALRHPETPIHLRLAGLALIAYLASPVDLIPIWIPVLGLVDDLVIVPWGLGAVVRHLPEGTRTDAEAAAARLIERYVARPLRFLLILGLVLILLWTTLLWLLYLGLRGAMG